MKRFLGLAALFGAFLLFAGAATAETAVETPDQSRAFVQGLADRTFNVLDRADLTSEERDAEFRRLLAEGFEVNYIGKLVLGSYRNRATPGQLAEFDRLFPDFIISIYADRLSQYGNEDFAITGTAPAGKNDLFVTSTVSPRSAPSFRADWRVRTFDGKPRIIDVKVDGISLLQTQRDDFSSRISRSGFDALLGDMRARVGQPAS
jgi:phospholipid transport system substrate-binding protein